MLAVSSCHIMLFYCLYSQLGVTMKKITLIVSVLLFFFTAVASAHGPVRQKAEETITINAPAPLGT